MDEEQKTPLPTEDQPAEQPVESSPPKAVVMHKSRWRRFRNWYGSHKKWAIPTTVLVVLLILAAIPWSRYQAAGLVIKKDLTIEVVDATSHTPVSGATVSAGPVSSQTDGEGQATLHLKSGNHSVLITKKYYQDQRTNVLVPIFGQKPLAALKLTATGRQVKIVVKNLVTEKPLKDVEIAVAETSAKTDTNGETLVVLPASGNSQEATLKLSGYNDSKATVKTSNTEVLENKFTLTPAGKVYFLSKRTGKINIMNSNLDGSDAKVVIEGTGKERDYDTFILPSADWKYVALLARRTTQYKTPQLHILSTEDDKLLGVDNSSAEYTPIGWEGDNLIYYSSRTDLPEWRAGNNKLKSYSASTGKITLLDQTSAVGDEYVSAAEHYAFIAIAGKSVFYAKDWSSYYDESGEELIASKKDTLSVIGSDGQGHKQLASYDASDYVQYAHVSPDTFYIWQQASSGDKFFEYSVGASSPKSANIDEDQFYDFGEIFYTSPSAQKSLWVEHRDGKHTVFVSDADGQNAKAIATASKFVPSGWFSDDYVLLIQDNTELYIMDAKGGKAVKITDFHSSFDFGY